MTKYKSSPTHSDIPTKPTYDELVQRLKNLLWHPPLFMDEFGVTHCRYCERQTETSIFDDFPHANWCDWDAAQDVIKRLDAAENAGAGE